MVRNIELLVETKRRLGSVRPHLRLVTVAMRQNLHELPALVRLAHQWAMEAMFVQHLCHDFGESSLPPHYRPLRDFVAAQTLVGEDRQRIEHYFGEARAVASALGVDLRLPRPRPLTHAPDVPGPQRCSWPWTGAYISYQGLAMPCCMVATPDRINFGNMAVQGVESVWNGAAYTQFRQQLDSANPPEICRSCAVYNRTF